MNICVFSPVPPPFHGSNYAVKLLLESEFKDKFNVTHIDTSYVKTLNDIGKPKLFKAVLFGKYLVKLFRENKKKYFNYIILIPSFSYWTFIRDSLTILFVAYFTNIKIILWIHTNDFLVQYGKRNNILKKYMIHVIRKAFKIVTVGNKLKDNFSEFVPDEKLITIYNGLPAVPYVRTKNKNDVKIEVIFLANMMVEKGWRNLLDAAINVCSSYSNVIFKFYGAPSKDSPIEEINYEFARSSFSDRILYMGSVTGDKKEQALSEADILCLPSYSEAFPFSILEAMQYSLPVIATDTGSISEAIINGKGGILLQSNNTNELVNALIYFIENPHKIIEMGEYNKRRFEENFKIDVCVKKWCEFFSKIDKN